MVLRGILALVASAVAIVGSCTSAEAKEPADARPVNTCEVGPWTSCPAAEWVAAIVEAGGYRIVGETGSALIAAGPEASFYAWANGETGVSTTLRHEVARGLYRVRGRLDGVPIYGDHVRVWWRGQGFVFWIEAGPREESAAPSLAGLRPLVAASQRLAPPR